MELHELQFGKIVLLQHNVAEVIINEGVELDLPMVETYHNFLLDHLTAPFCVLINRINAYTYNFEAQQKIGSLNDLRAIAIVAYNHVAETTSETLINFPRDNRWNARIFKQRDKALSWLQTQIANSQQRQQR